LKQTIRHLAAQSPLSLEHRVKGFARQLAARRQYQSSPEIVPNHSDIAVSAFD
jgi:hypothetical protein